MDHAMITIGGYAVTSLGFWGTLLYLWSVWLVGRGSVWAWPVGNLAVLLPGRWFRAGKDMSR